LRKSDIINISETWIEKEDKIMDHKMKNHEYVQIKARREKKRGRPKGGMVMAHRKSLITKKIGIEKVTDEVMKMEIDTGNEVIIVISTYMRENRKENYEKIAEIIEENKDRYIIIGGDFNARTAEKGGRIEDDIAEERRSSEDKIINEEGRVLIKWLEENGLYIINGNVQGEEKGSMTYIGAAGRSVIDYVITNRKGEEKIDKMEIVEGTASDHLMIKVNLRTGMKREDEIKKEKEIIKWSDKEIEEYKEKLTKIRGVSEWKDLKNKIRNSIPVKKIKVKDGTDEKGWWDEECHIAKKELKDAKRRYREDGTKKDQYLICRRKYRSLLEKKKTNYKEREWIEAKKDKTGKKFWEIINRQKRRRTKMSDKIKMSEWKEHFQEQMEGTVEKEAEVIDRAVNQGEEIGLKEVKDVIKKMKRKKAAGEDKIPNEAWLYGGEETAEELHRIINKIWNGEQELPEEWKTGVVIPIYKKGDIHDVRNYRGITLMDTGYKIYAEIIRKRLEKEMEEKELMGETQTGYRKGKGTLEAIYIVKTAMEEETKKEKGEIYLFFADMKGAFDKLRREKLWELMEKNEISSKLRDRIKEIYNGTAFKIRIDEKISEEIYTKKGVRQGCPLSTTLFNLAFADLESTMKSVQLGGIVIGKKKVWTVSYADDVVLLANNEEGIKEMIRKFKKYIQDRGLELNIDKSKIMRGRKAGGRKKNITFTWEGKEIEEVKEFNYLGYTLQKNNGNEAHIKNIRKKAMTVLGKVWSIGERNFKDNWKKRMYLFEVLMESIIMYGVEIWGWKEYKEIESLQDKYIKWTLKLDQTTPSHMLHMETKRNKIATKSGTRAVKYEEKIMKNEGNELIKECIKVKNKFSLEIRSNKKGETGEKWKYARKKYFEEKGWSMEYYNCKMENGSGIWIELEEISKSIERQIWNEKLEKSRFAMEYKNLVPEAMKKPEYLRKENNSRRAMEMKARFRLGTETKANRYWEIEEKRKCRLCGKEEETLQHVFETCEMTGERHESWKRQINGARALARMWSITWRRKREEEKLA